MRAQGLVTTKNGREVGSPAWKLNVVQVPIYRVAAFLAAAGLLFLHNRFYLGVPAWDETGRFLVYGLGYAIVTWLALYLFWARFPRLHLGTLSLVLDSITYSYIIVLSGGERSLLFFLPFLQVVDQLFTTFRRAFFFAHLPPLTYLGAVLFLSVTHGEAIDRSDLFLKMLILYGFSLFIAPFAQTAGRIRAARRKAEEANRTKSLFLASMSHELRTPLNHILLYAQLLEEDAQAVQLGGMVEDLRKISGSAGHLLKIIDEILGMAELEAGRAVLNPRPFDLSSLIHKCVDQVRPLAVLRGVSLVVQAPVGPLEVILDAAKVAQVLQNLLDNACKFSEGGEVHCQVAVEAPQTGAPGVLRMVVLDSGIGITQDQIERIFEPFTQVDGSLTRPYGGTGLGLATSRRYVELMGGTLTVESTPGAGSAFSVWLPLQEIQAETGAPAQASQDRPL